MLDHAEAVRENYRRQGAERIVDRIIQDLQSDAMIQLSFNAWALEQVVRVVEGALHQVQLVPNE